MAKQVLIVDDDTSVTKRFAQYLEGTDIEAHVANTSPDALKIAQQQPLQAGTLDFSIDERNGNQLAAELRKYRPDIKLAGLSAGHLSSLDYQLFDIVEPKPDHAAQYRLIVQSLLDPQTLQKYKDRKALAVQDILPSLSILLQGYNMALACNNERTPLELSLASSEIAKDLPDDFAASYETLLTKGVRKMDTGIFNRLKPGPLDVSHLLDLNDVGLSVESAYEAWLEIDPSIVANTTVAHFFDLLRTGRHAEVPYGVSAYMECFVREALEGPKPDY